MALPDICPASRMFATSAGLLTTRNLLISGFSWWTFNPASFFNLLIVEAKLDSDESPEPLMNLEKAVPCCVGGYGSVYKCFAPSRSFGNSVLILEMSPLYAHNLAIKNYYRTQVWTLTWSALKTSKAACVPDLAPSHSSASSFFSLTRRWKDDSFSLLTIWHQKNRWALFISWSYQLLPRLPALEILVWFSTYDVEFKRTFTNQSDIGSWCSDRTDRIQVLIGIWCLRLEWWRLNPLVTEPLVSLDAQSIQQLLYHGWL